MTHDELVKIYKHVVKAHDTCPVHTAASIVNDMANSIADSDGDTSWAEVMAIFGAAMTEVCCQRGMNSDFMGEVMKQTLENLEENGIKVLVLHGHEIQPSTETKQ